MIRNISGPISAILLTNRSPILSEDEEGNKLQIHRAVKREIVLLVWLYVCTQRSYSGYHLY